jgi:hypothetical protein
MRKQAPWRYERLAQPASNTMLQQSRDSKESSQTPNMYTRYIQLLDTSPLLTKSISSGIVAFLGGMLAQSIESQKAHIPTTFNWTRLLSFFICNTLYVGPFLHFWWEQLWKLGRWMQETHGARKRSTILVQLLIDQTIGVIVFFPTYFYAYEMAESLLLWKTPVLTNAWNKCVEQLQSVFIMQYKVWPVVNFFIFTFIPEKLRVLAGNIAAVVWNAYLCTRVA